MAICEICNQTVDFESGGVIVHTEEIHCAHHTCLNNWVEANPAVEDERSEWINPCEGATPKCILRITIGLICMPLGYPLLFHATSQLEIRDPRYWIVYGFSTLIFLLANYLRCHQEKIKQRELELIANNGYITVISVIIFQILGISFKSIYQNRLEFHPTVFTALFGAGFAFIFALGLCGTTALIMVIAEIIKKCRKKKVPVQPMTQVTIYHPNMEESISISTDSVSSSDQEVPPNTPRWQRSYSMPNIGASRKDPLYESKESSTDGAIYATSRGL